MDSPHGVVDHIVAGLLAISYQCVLFVHSFCGIFVGRVGLASLPVRLSTFFLHSFRASRLMFFPSGLSRLSSTWIRRLRFSGSLNSRLSTSRPLGFLALTCMFSSSSMSKPDRTCQGRNPVDKFCLWRLTSSSQLARQWDGHETNTPPSCLCGTTTLTNKGAVSPCFAVQARILVSSLDDCDVVVIRAEAMAPLPIHPVRSRGARICQSVSFVPDSASTQRQLL